MEVIGVRLTTSGQVMCGPTFKDLNCLSCGPTCLYIEGLISSLKKVILIAD